MENTKESRKNIRVGIRQLASIVFHAGKYKAIDEDAKATSASITINDISLGGMSITSNQKVLVKRGTVINLEIPKIGWVDAKMITCEVTWVPIEDNWDSLPSLKLIDSSNCKIGLKFINPDSEYLKQLLEAIKTYKI